MQDRANTIVISKEFKLELSEIIEKETIIIPQLPPDKFIGEIGSVKLADARLFIEDKMMQTIFIFSTSGLFEGAVDHIGAGPEEYLELSDFTIYNETIWILSRANKSIYRYNFQGQFLDRITLPDWFTRFYVLNDHHLALYSEASNQLHYNFILYDYTTNKVIQKFDHFDHNISYCFEKMHPFHPIGCDSLLITKPFDPILYLLTANNFSIAYRLNFDDFTSPPASLRSENKYADLSLFVQEYGGLKLIPYILQKGDMLLLFYISSSPEFGLRWNIARLNVAQQKSATIRLGDEVDNLYPFLTTLNGVSNGYIIRQLSFEGYYKLNKERGIEIPIKKHLEEESFLFILYKIKDQL